MRLVRFYHWIEKRFLFKRAVWISQTNEDRRRLFQVDRPGILSRKLMILPNYPPRAWHDEPQADWQVCRDQPLKLVYVGSISLHDTFIQPLIRWVQETATRPRRRHPTLHLHELLRGPRPAAPQSDVQAVGSPRPPRARRPHLRGWQAPPHRPAMVRVVGARFILARNVQAASRRGTSA